MAVVSRDVRATGRQRQARLSLVPPASVEAAKDAGLRYVADDEPGIVRQRRGRGTVYRDPDGTLVRDPTTLARIRSLAIPPAWRDVWICKDPQGHIQATGRDAKGRKQYRYHPRWRTVRDETKYERMAAFGRMLPAIRRRVEQDLALPGLPRDKILATVVRLLELTLIRVGNEEYARRNDSFGLATMRDRHVAVNGSSLRFEFRGKSGIRHTVDLHDRRLAAIVRRSRDLPGYELFQYVDEQGNRHRIDATDVNAYLKAAAGADCTAKDFRTWAGTVLAFRFLSELACGPSRKESKQAVLKCIESVARRLGNTKAICRKCYIHPMILTAFQDGRFFDATPLGRSRAGRNGAGLTGEEAAVLRFLRQPLLKGARHACA